MNPFPDLRHLAAHTRHVYEQFGPQYDAERAKNRTGGTVGVIYRRAPTRQKGKSSYI